MNLLKQPIKSCSFDPITGYHRTGFCEFHPSDQGAHLVCAKLTKEFLEFTRSQGNNLTGLKPGQKWCLCIFRWLDAYKHGVAPPIYFSSTHSNVVDVVPLKVLSKYRID